MKSLFILSILLSLLPKISIAQDFVVVDYFSPDQEKFWQSKVFKGKTSYEFINQEGKFVLKASCDGTASALYRRMDIDLTKTPILQWSWKIDATHDGLDDISKGGDDYAARIYVVYKGLMPWDVLALDYVWANAQPKDASWPNAFSSRAVMIAQESGNSGNKDLWVRESRNVLKDFKQYFERDIRNIDGVAIMTDCDNGKGKAIGYYRDIKFMPLSSNL